MSGGAVSTAVVLEPKQTKKKKKRKKKSRTENTRENKWCRWVSSSLKSKNGLCESSWERKSGE